MRMESKRSIIWLVIIMILIYLQQSMISYAEEQAEITRYELEISENTGENGYYVKKPEIKITHSDLFYTTKYQLMKGEEILTEGELSIAMQEVCISEEFFEEGKQILSIWMENAEGIEVSETRTVTEIFIDSVNPELQVEAPAGFHTWYSQQVVLKLQAKDHGSKIKTIHCFVNGEKKGATNREEAEFVIASGSIGGKEVKVLFQAEDYAGNIAQVEKNLFIDQHIPEIKITGIEEHQITNQSVNVNYEVIEENVLQEKMVYIERENPAGEKKKIDSASWENFSGNKKLKKDGIYRVIVAAKDLAGHTAQKEIKFVIDTEKPVIRYVGNLNHQYQKKFVWENIKKDFVTDFTTYKYEIKLDGKLYHLGERIVTEGRHVLEVSATDEAGNCAVEKAVFFIDHTAPEIFIENVEDGENYEKERTIVVKLGNTWDTIQKIMINGKAQVIEKGRYMHEYTLEEPGDYEIVVQATDYAGNTAEIIKNFTICPEKRMIEKVVEPVKEVVEEKIESKENVNKKAQIYVWPVAAAGGVLFIVIIAAVIYWKKNRQGEEEV